jgi:hypothetical protein
MNLKPVLALVILALILSILAVGVILYLSQHTTDLEHRLSLLELELDYCNQHRQLSEDHIVWQREQLAEGVAVIGEEAQWLEEECGQ